MATRPKFGIGEWYHCFNRGIEGRLTFENVADYERFLSLLYLANDTQQITIFNDRNISLSEAMTRKREQTIVTVGAYCLMPNHYHLILREDREGGISMFMQKLGTAYTMYFNAKNKRIGNLFMKPFRSKHIANDEYFQQVIRYVHFNPAELFESGWKQGKAKNLSRLETKLLSYPYASLKDYENKSSPTRKLIGNGVFDSYRKIPVSHMMQDAYAYYQEHAEDHILL